MGMHIVIAGSVVDGFEFFGPFKTAEHAVDWASRYAVDWASRYAVDMEWTVAPLMHPTEESES